MKHKLFSIATAIGFVLFALMVLYAYKPSHQPGTDYNTTTSQKQAVLGVHTTTQPAVINTVEPAAVSKPATTNQPTQQAVVSPSPTQAPVTETPSVKAVPPIETKPIAKAPSKKPAIVEGLLHVISTAQL